MSIEEIEKQIDSKNDEDVCDRILSESAFKEPTKERDRLPSKHDSGIESCGHDVDVGDLSTLLADTSEPRLVIKSTRHLVHKTFLVKMINYKLLFVFLKPLYK